MFRSARTAGAAALLAVSIVATAAGGAPGTAAAAAVLPADFSDSAVATVSAPTAVESLGDGRVVILAQSGTVRIVSGGTLLATPALSLALGGCGGGEMGLLGFAPGADFATTGAVFVFYTRPFNGKCVNTVSKFTMSGNTIDPASEVVLLDLPGTVTDSAANHNGGDLDIGKDGYLYVTIGDSGADPRQDPGHAAQDLGLLAGKVLRITTDGQIPPDNPFTGPGTARCQFDATDNNGAIDNPSTTTCQEIFAYGLRNPYRFAFDPNNASTRFVINDVGQSTREEVDEGIAGANYGWNQREGQCPTGQSPPCAGPSGGLVDPITDYPRSVGTYITGGAFVPTGAWGGSYDGGYLFADGGTGKIFLRTAAGTVDYANPFANELGEIADLAFVAEGGGYALYYTQNSANSVRKISYTGAPPADPVSGLRLEPIIPKRVYDTRNAIGGPSGLVAAGSTRTIDVQRPNGEVKAVLANLTLAEAQGAGFAQAWSTGTARPSTSVINSTAAGETVANSVILPIGADGTISVGTSVTAHLLLDVLGYFTAAAGNGGEYRPLAPRRLVDTRQPAGNDATFGSGSGNPYETVGDHLELQVGGKLGVPGDTSAGAVALILTAIGDASGRSGYATAYPAGVPRPEASNVNTTGALDTRANLVVVPLGANGKVSLFGFATEDLIVDVAGWFSAASVPSGGTGRLTVIGSTRVADSRQSPPTGFARLGAGTGASLDVTPPLPAGASAVIHNLTIPSASGWGFVTAAPDGSAVPTVSNLNVTAAGQNRAALALTALPTSGVVRYQTYAGTDLIVDVYGYFS